MSSTTNVYRKNYQKRGRRKKFSPQEKRMYKIAKKAIESNEKKVVELKNYDVEQAYTVTGIPSTGQVDALTSGIAQGDTAITREGDQITLKSIFLRFEIIHGDSTNIFRIILFRWMEATVPSISSVLESNVTAGYPLSPLLRNANHRIQVLYDNLFAQSTNTNANIVEKVYVNKNLGNCEWQQTGSVESGQVYLLMVSDSGGAPNPTIKYYSRVTYTDQ